jgi:hypothetical protein
MWREIWLLGFFGRGSGEGTKKVHFDEASMPSSSSGISRYRRDLVPRFLIAEFSPDGDKLNWWASTNVRVAFKTYNKLAELPTVQVIAVECHSNTKYLADFQVQCDHDLDKFLMFVARNYCSNMFTPRVLPEPETFYLETVQDEQDALVICDTLGVNVKFVIIQDEVIQIIAAYQTGFIRIFSVNTSGVELDLYRAEKGYLTCNTLIEIFIQKGASKWFPQSFNF